MGKHRSGATIALAAMLSACGGSGGGSGSGGSTSSSAGGGGSSSTPTPTASGCTLRERQDWVAAQLDEWYLFPETLPNNPNPAAYSSVEDYLDSLTATARAQGKDRYFTYLTSIADENAYYESGSSAGYGFRLSLDSDDRLYSAESFEGSPALVAGIDRGTEIVAIGTTSNNLRTVSAILASEGIAGLNNALGPSNAGVTRVFRVRDSAGPRTVSVTQAEYELTSVSSRYGAQIIDDGGKKVGYVNLRTFISTADPALRQAFAGFRSAGVSEVIVDLRYNGGGLVSIAELFGNLLGRNRSASDIFSITAFRSSKSSENSTEYFTPQPQSVAPAKIAFIGTGGTASASELVINGFIPYLHANAALIGNNTYGKPVGQIALDRSACDDRLRVVAFAKQNASRQGAYYTGLASVVEASCQAADDITRPLGDPQEASTRRALDYLAGRSCTTIAQGGQGAQSLRTGVTRELLTPERPTTAQIETPGLY